MIEEPDPAHAASVSSLSESRTRPKRLLEIRPPQCIRSLPTVAFERAQFRSTWTLLLLLLRHFLPVVAAITQSVQGWPEEKVLFLFFLFRLRASGSTLAYNLRVLRATVA